MQTTELAKHNKDRNLKLFDRAYEGLRNLHKVWALAMYSVHGEDVPHIQLAGGALRDLYFDLPIKDFDIFIDVDNLATSRVEKLQRSLLIYLNMQYPNDEVTMTEKDCDYLYADTAIKPFYINIHQHDYHTPVQFNFILNANLHQQGSALISSMFPLDVSQVFMDLQTGKVYSTVAFKESLDFIRNIENRSLANPHHKHVRIVVDERKLPSRWQSSSYVHKIKDKFNEHKHYLPFLRTFQAEAQGEYTRADKSIVTEGIV